ncbi:SpaH/EbpB family LPXTG-anchored major pilin [Gardnerella swidsinskii]|uniref:SpaH/EbpB family LPXTG-anchored major pilin n=1 Tax=Gardnerella swidsinskii TaxID=2792979 RepID=UPI0039EFE9BA
MKKFTNKFVAAVASLAMAGTLCVAGAVTVSSVAWANKPGVSQPSVNKGSKAPWESKAPTTGSLTIVKCRKKDVSTTTTTVASSSTANASASNETGKTQDTSCPAGFESLKDVSFTVTKVASIKEGTNDVTLNLAQYDSWQKIAGIVSKLNAHPEEAGVVTLGTGTDVHNMTATDKDGKSTLNNLSVGLYKIVEKVPDGYGAYDFSSFYMTLPLIEQKTDNGKTTTVYEYNPVVKPKNIDLSSAIKKNVDKSHIFAGVKDKIYYTITAKVNKTKIGKDLTEKNLTDYAVFDDAPTSAFTEPNNQGLDAAVQSVKFGTGSDSTFTKGENNDYTVTATANSDNAEITTAGDTKGLAAGHTRILVKFTEAGLKKIASKLNNVAAGSEAPQVEVELAFDISKAFKDSTTDKTITNKSGFFPAHDEGTTAPNPIIPNVDGSKPTVKFGYLQVDKYNSEDESKKLSGAEFKIFTDKEKADLCTKSLKENTAVDAEDSPCKAASAFDETTVEGGKFSNPYKAEAGSTLYVVEVKAPEGFALSPVVKEITVKDTTTNDNPDTLKFPNIPLHGEKGGNKFWFNLPATGAAGVILFALAGMGLIAASVFLYMRNRKEEEQQQNA